MEILKEMDNYLSGLGIKSLDEWIGKLKA